MAEAALMIRKAAILAGLLAAAAPAFASVDVPDRAVWSLTDVDSLQFCAKCAPEDVPSATRLENYKRTIADTVQMGARHILVQAVAGSGRATRLGEFAQALASYNAAAPAGDRACMAVLYADYGAAHTDSEITSLYTTAWDTSGTHYCSIGGRPVVATLDDRPDQTCVPSKVANIIARLRTLASGVAPTAVHWIAAFGERSEYADWQSACRDKVSATVPVSYSYLEMANDDPAFMTEATTRRDAVKAAGGRYILGLPTASAQNCGAFCGTGADSSAYRHTDFDGFARLLSAWRAGADQVAYTFGPGGPYGKDQFVSTATRCDANDLVTPSADCASVAALDEPLVPGVPVADGTVVVDPPPPPPPATGPQCTNITPPAEAAAAGQTKLAFCDDFSTDTVARGSTEESRKIVSGKKWTSQNACFGGSNDGSGSGAGGCNPQPAGDFKFNSDGTLSVKPTFNKYQSFMQSAYLGTDKVISGYYINQQAKGWWFEAKFRVDSYGGGDDEQPAIWTMDLCWWFKQWPCSRMGRGDRMLEQDISEYDTGNSYLHQWITNPWSREKTCSAGGKSLVVGQWRTVAWHVLPTGESHYYRDGVKGGDCTVGESGVFSDLLLKGTHPILMGSRFDNMTFDYVRVWEAP